jgi:hypothetical protein
VSRSAGFRQPHNLARTACAVAVAASLLTLLVSPVNAAASWYWGGWLATANWQGVDGYIRQSTTVTVPHGNPEPHHLDWIEIAPIKDISMAGLILARR